MELLRPPPRPIGVALAQIEPPRFLRQRWRFARLGSGGEPVPAPVELGRTKGVLRQLRQPLRCNTLPKLFQCLVRVVAQSRPSRLIGAPV